MTISEEEFAETYREHLEFVRRAVLRLGVMEAEVDDICQEVFLVVLRKIVHFEGRSSLRTWLFSILKRVVHSHRRSFARKEARQDLCDLDGFGVLEAPGHYPDQSACLREQLHVAEALLSEVDSEKRPLLLLVDVEEMSVSEAAESLNLNPNTASARLRAGRQQMAAALARYRAKAAFQERAEVFLSGCTRGR